MKNVNFVSFFIVHSLNWAQIEEFTLFISDVIEGIISNDIVMSGELVNLFKKIPTIIEGMAKDNNVALPEAQEFIQALTHIIDNSHSDNKENKFNKNDSENDNIIDNDLKVDQEDLKNKLRMELN